MGLWFGRRCLILGSSLLTLGWLTHPYVILLPAVLMEMLTFKSINHRSCWNRGNSHGSAKIRKHYLSGQEISSTVAQLIEPLPHTIRYPDSILDLRCCRCGVCTFSLKLHGFPLDSSVISHMPKVLAIINGVGIEGRWRLGEYEENKKSD